MADPSEKRCRVAEPQTASYPGRASLDFGLPSTGCGVPRQTKWRAGEGERQALGANKLGLRS